MSWESTVSYYQAINQGVRASLGGLHSAKLVLLSVDFAEIEHMQHKGDWHGAAEVLVDAALSLRAVGADAILICTNTMHKVADQIDQAVDIPLIHIADATADALLSNNVNRVGLLGTAFTMEQNFYKGRLIEHGLQVIVPDATDRELVNTVIYHELCKGQINQQSKKAYLNVIQQLKGAGVQAVILGCTEIGLLVQQLDTNVPLYDTTVIHAQAAVDFILS